MSEGQIYLGNLLDYTRDTGNKIWLEDVDINKHILVAGMTGSGKTNTVFSLINNSKVPFLVIEPAKTEYRVLKTLIPDLRIYTLGREQVSPFRMNPFQFDYRTISLQEHIDNLKVIFISAFSMYASMPNILEQCLINIYTQKGWSLLNSTNVLCEGEVESYFYPTLEDLYMEIDHYIDALGYAQEQNQNIRAALLTRIKSLMLGAKGFMLNAEHPIDISELLMHPTVLELEGIADDTEKSLMIGFIMLNVYEYVKANFEGYSGKLKHTIIIEEAHRLFANVGNSENQEQVNMKQKAVETLSNMLCEIRSYGEGFIIVDQVPTKLAPDVLKNTNTKIIHKLVSKDDCEYISKAIQISDENIDFISQLKVGQALVYNEKLEKTAHIKVNFNKDKYKYFKDNEIRIFAQRYNCALNEQVIAHPIVEILYNYPITKEAILKVTEEYIKKLSAKNDVTDIYNELKKSYVQLAINNGFMIRDYYDEYTQELALKSITKYLSTTRTANNIYQKQHYLAIIKCALELGRLGKAAKPKEINAFNIALRSFVFIK